MSHDLTTVNLGGERAALIAPSIPDSAPAAVREGLARRRLVAAGQPCPCGAVLRPPNRAEKRAAKRSGGVLHATVRHARDCEAASENIDKAWRAS